MSRNPTKRPSHSRHQSLDDQLDALRATSESIPSDGEAARHALDLVPAMIAYVNSDRTYRFVSASFSRSFRALPHEMVGQPIDQAMPDDLASKLAPYVAAALSGDVQRFEFSFRDDGNRQRWIYAHFLPDHNEAKGTVGFLAFLQDVGERKHLETLQDRFRYALDQGMEGFALHDEVGDFTYVNRAQAEMYGYQPEELIGRSWRSLYCPRRITEIEETCFPVLLETGKWRGELVGRKKDGTFFDVEVSLTLLTGEDGKSGGLLCTCRDITERKASEEHLRQLQRIDALGHLTGGVAHDFNNILAVIISNLELLRTANDNPKLCDAIEQTLKAGERGAALTNRLLAFARRQVLAPESLNARELIDGMQDMLSRSLGERYVLKVQSEPELWDCKADRSQLENAILNLVVNARDATPEGGIICLDLENHIAHRSDGARDQFVRIAVIDNGSGMDDATLQKMFDPFFTTKRSGQGTGLGLSMVHGFVSQTGGFTRATSEVGQGSCVAIHLPRQSVSAQVVESGDENVPLGRGESVLVVEDDPNVRLAIANLLRALNYSVVEAEGVGEAISTVTSRQIDIILSDVVLPGNRSGLELFNWIQTSSRSLKIVFMSGYSEVNVPPGVAMIGKPFSKAQLARELSAALNERGAVGH